MMKTGTCAIIIALLALTGECCAGLLDLGEYMLDTGEYLNNPTFAFALNNTTTGDYSALAGFGSAESGRVSIMLTRSKENRSLDPLNYTSRGYVAVSKPYAGYLSTNSTQDKVVYEAMVDSHLKIIATIERIDRAALVLKDLSVISRAEYNSQAESALVNSLS